FGNSGSSYTLSDGTLSCSAASLSSSAAGGALLFVQNGGTFLPGGLTVGSFATMQLNGGTCQPSTMNVNGTMTMSNGYFQASAVTTSGILTIGGGSLRALGSLTMSTSGSSSFTSPQIVLNGGSVSGAGVTINAGSFTQNDGLASFTGKL